jgi:hypothetical protein
MIGKEELERVGASHTKRYWLSNLGSILVDLSAGAYEMCDAASGGAAEEELFRNDIFKISWKRLASCCFAVVSNIKKKHTGSS